MSGWDTSSRPTWGQPDGPDDSQTHSDLDNSVDPGNPWDRPSLPPTGDPWDPREPDGQGFGSSSFAEQANGYGDGEETAAGYPRRTPGRTLGQGIGLGQPGLGQPGLGQPGGGQPGNGRPDFGQQDLPRREARGRHSGAGQDQPGAMNPGTAPWEAPVEQPGPAWGGAPEQPNSDPWGTPPQGSQGRPLPRWEERPRDNGRPDPGVPAPDPRWPGQDYSGADHSGAGGFPGQQARGPQGPLSGPREHGDVARMDPALQDFFSPQEQQQRQEMGRPHSARPDDFRPPLPPLPPPGQRGGGAGYPEPGEYQEPGGYPEPNGYPEQGPRSGPGQPGQPGQPDRPGQPPRRARLLDDGWDAPPRPPRPPVNRNTGSSRISRTTGAIRALRGDDEGPGFGKRVYFTVGVILVLIVVVVVILTNQHSGKPTGTSGSDVPPGTILPSSTPATPKTTTTPTTSTAPSKPAKTHAAPATSGYVLSAPATAGGYPKGQDPHFLATATGTAQQIASSVTSGGGGTAKGSPVSAAYRLPSGGQVITFVGYQGTFSPTKIATILGSLGTDQSTYPAGPHGGTFGCANTPASGSTPSGAVCVWATTTTLGVTEFFSSTGPEVLTVSQAKGATDSLALRASVEAKHS